MGDISKGLGNTLTAKKYLPKKYFKKVIGFGFGLVPE
jgi:hypothetical protein